MKLGQSLAMFSMGLATLICGIRTNNASQENKVKKAERLMEYVMANNPNKYAETLNKCADNSISKNVKIWEQAANEVRDSLKIDSIAKTNYAKGAQMVRDSIAKANLNEFVKTVTKSVK